MLDLSSTKLEDSMINVYIQYMNILNRGWIDFQTGLNNMSKLWRFSVAVELKHMNSNLIVLGNGKLCTRWKQIWYVYSHLYHFYSSSQMKRFNSKTQHNLWGLTKLPIWSSSMRRPAWDGTFTKQNLILPARASWYMFPLKQNTEKQMHKICFERHVEDTEIGKVKWDLQEK